MYLWPKSNWTWSKCDFIVLFTATKLKLGLKQLMWRIPGGVGLDDLKVGRMWIRSNESRLNHQGEKGSF